MNNTPCNICGSKDVVNKSSLCAACDHDYYEYNCSACGVNCCVLKEYYPKYREIQVCDICEQKDLLRNIPIEKLDQIDTLIKRQEKITAIKLLGEELNLSPVKSGRLVGIREVWINEKNI